MQNHNNVVLKAFFFFLFCRFQRNSENTIYLAFPKAWETNLFRDALLQFDDFVLEAFVVLLEMVDAFGFGSEAFEFFGGEFAPRVRLQQNQTHPHFLESTLANESTSIPDRE